MENQLIDEIKGLTDGKLNEYIELFENRVEATREYLQDIDSFEVSQVMQGKFQEYSYKLKLMLEEQKRRNAENEAMVENPARPTNVKITRENQIKTYKIYEKCPDYRRKIGPFLSNPYIYGNPFAQQATLCKEDCLFPTCPFYDMWANTNRAVHHKEDYDEWIVQGYEERFRNT